jgi:hypothetical protein
MADKGDRVEAETTEPIADEHEDVRRRFVELWNELTSGGAAQTAARQPVATLPENNASARGEVALTMTPIQAKALATLIGRSARRGSGLDTLRIALIRGASEVDSREPSSAAAAVLAEARSFVAGAQTDIAALREAKYVAKSATATKRSVVAAALMAAEAASRARDAKAGAAARAALDMADAAAQMASGIQARADALAVRVATAASTAADIVLASIASGGEEEGALIALQLAATVDAAAIAIAEETALAAAAVATAVASAATEAALAAAAAAAAFEKEVANAAAAVKRVAITTAHDLALNADAKAVEVAQAAIGPRRF